MARRNVDIKIVPLVWLPIELTELIEGAFNFDYRLQGIAAFRREPQRMSSTSLREKLLRDLGVFISRPREANDPVL